MKALITAGGRATRLRPITHTINKHLIPIANRPMIFHAIEKIAETGINDIGININVGDTEMPAAIGDGSRWGVKITYIEQTGGAKGLAHIIKNAKDKGFLTGEPFLMYLGDNIIFGSIKQVVDRYRLGSLNCLLTLAKVKNPQQFGVPEFLDGKVIKIVEKPKEPKSNFAVTGIYLYDKHALDAVEVIEPSARGEYEISDVNQYYIDKGLAVGYEEITNWWKDTGKPEDLLEANQLVLNEIKNEEAVHLGEIDSAAVIQGKVRIEEGTKIGIGVLIRGPVVIGKNCIIENSCIGPHTSIGNGVEIRNTEIDHSIILDNAKINCGVRLVDALVGYNAVINSANDSLPHGHKLIIGDHSVVEV